MFTALVKEELQKRGLSFRDAAKQIGVAHTTVIRATRGDPLDIDNLIKFCAWLGVKPATVLNSFANDDITASISMIIEREPKLAEIFKQAIDDLEEGRISPEDLSDIVNYAAYKLQMSRKENE